MFINFFNGKFPLRDRGPVTPIRLKHPSRSPTIRFLTKTKCPCCYYFFFQF
nr:MAG: hypothetical protein DiTV3a_F2ORF16 [Diabrotica toursvirus 3a]